MSNFLVEGKLDQFFTTEFEELKEGAFASGRKLFVLKGAQKDFNDVIAARKNNFNSLYFYNQILSLKNLGFLSSQFSCVSPITKRLKIEGGEIIYAVWKGTVYITQVNQVTGDAANPPAGVYKVRKVDDTDMKWQVESSGESPSLRPFIDTANIAINGSFTGINEAAKYMPDFIRYGYGEQALNDVYSLFYNPSTSTNNSDWRSLKDTLGFTTQAAKKLVDTLTLSATRGKDVNLTVHENGHALLSECLKRVSDKGVDLSKFTVFYANPTKNLAMLEVWRKRVGMKLADKPALINPISVHQNFLTGNIISQPLVSIINKPQNAISIGYNGFGSVAMIAGAGAIGAGFWGAAGWAISAGPLLFGQGRALNKKVIDSVGVALEEGLKHTATNSKKLIWDPVHKMMVRA